MKVLLAALCLVALAIAVDYKQLIPIPAGAGKNQNGFTYLKTSTMLNLFGKPCSLTANCQSVTNPSLKNKIETRKIGKFRLSGMKQALDAISRALDEVARKDPGLYGALGSSGMLCCRAIRGSSTAFSNHAWGAAADFNIQGKLDPRGDKKTQRGLAMLWPYMAKQGFYWAAGYSGASEDAMHFEIADEVMRNWAKGDWGACTSSKGVKGKCVDTDECKATTESGRCPGPANIKCCFSSTPAPVIKYKCVTADTLNIRSGPCTTNNVVGQVHDGDALQIVNAATRSGCSNTWINIRRNGITGWVSTSFVKDCTPSGANEFNSTIGDEPLDGFEFGDPEDYVYSEEEDSASVLSVLFSLALIFAVLF